MGKVRPQKCRGLRNSCCPPQVLVDVNSELHEALTFSSSFQPQNIEASQDFGGMIHRIPGCVVSPSSTEAISNLVKAANGSSKLTITARGNGHSVNGQSQAVNSNGIVILTTNMPAHIHVVIPGGEDSLTRPFVEVSAGVLWIDVLRETLKHGLAPRSWTDYLYLTVGGTLSNAGVSGQAFHHGPQISNVLQLEVVTGKGDVVTCSSKRNSELFFAVLGGLGQFGIITKARVLLEEAPERARYLRLLYADFEDFRRDIEYLITDHTANYVEGVVVPNTDDPQGWKSVPFQGQKLDPKLIPKSSGPVLYCIEIAKYYNQRESIPAENELSSLLSTLSCISKLHFTVDLTYFEFLNRVRDVEESLRKIHLWDVPHPWLTLFVPRSKISEFNNLVFKDIVRKGVNGPMLVYPLNRSKWDARSSAVIPDESVFYMICLLRYVVEQGQPVEAHLEQNQQILSVCESNGLGVKQYFPHYLTEADWKKHFGDSWGKFSRNKLKFDPNAVLCPGQRIFTRNKVASDW